MKRVGVWGDGRGSGSASVQVICIPRLNEAAGGLEERGQKGVPAIVETMDTQAASAIYWVTYHVMNRGGGASRFSGTRKREGDSGDEFLDHMPVDIGQAKVAAGAAEGEFLVIEAEQRENGRVEIMDVNLVLNRRESEFIGCSVNVAALDSASGHPGGEAVMIVIATIDLAGV